MNPSVQSFLFPGMDLQSNKSTSASVSVTVPLHNVIRCVFIWPVNTGSAIISDLEHCV